MQLYSLKVKITLTSDIEFMHEWSYTFTLPIRIRGADRGNCTFCVYYHTPWIQVQRCIKTKVKRTLVRALRLCTGRTVYRGSTRRGWGISVTPRPLFTPGKDPVPIVQEAGWAPGPVWTGVENVAHAGIRFPDRPGRSQSLHRLRYPAHIPIMVLVYFPSVSLDKCIVLPSAACLKLMEKRIKYLPSPGFETDVLLTGNPYCEWNISANPSGKNKSRTEFKLFKFPSTKF